MIWVLTIFYCFLHILLHLSFFHLSHVTFLVFHLPAHLFSPFSPRLPFSIVFSLSLALSQVWPWGQTMSPERIEEKGEGAKRKKRKNNSHVTQSSPPPSPAPHVSFLSLFVCVNEKLWRGEKESVSIGPLKDAAQAARPPPHCERTSHLYHTGKSINPGSERESIQCGGFEEEDKQEEEEEGQEERVKKVSTSPVEEGLREWLTDWHKNTIWHD